MAESQTNKIVNDSATRMVQQSGDLRQPATPRFALGALSEGTILCGDCRVIQTLRAHETGRPGVYLCETPSEHVVVKIYPLDYPPSPEMWAQIGHMNHPHVVRTIRQVLQDGFYYDVQQYCEHGSLVEAYSNHEAGMSLLPSELITATLAPQILEALQYVHASGLVHRDIKPSNILVHGDMADPSFLLSDFDISSQLNLQVDQRITTRAAGTWTYTAPEAFPRYQDDEGVVGAKVTRASDYYSLGVTMLEMACGTTPLHTCKLPDMFDFYLSGQKIDVPINIPDRLRMLIQGMLIRQPQMRWGEAEVNRWLGGNNTPEDIERIQRMQGNPITTKTLAEFRYGEQLIQNPGQLGQLLADDLDAAAVFLRQPGDLWSWLGRIDENRTVTVRKRITAATNGGAEVLLVCSLNPQAACRIGQRVLDTPQQWLDMMSDSQDTYISNPELYRFIYWLYYHENGNPALAKRVMSMTKTPEVIRLYELRWAMHPEIPLTVKQGYDASTPDQFATIAYGTEADWSGGRCECYQRAMEIWQDGILDAWLRQLGMQQIALRSVQLRNSYKDQLVTGFEELLHLLNPNLTKPKVTVSSVALVRVPFQKSAVVQVPYTTSGPGNPVINVSWQKNSMLTPSSTQFVGRNGIIEAAFSAQTGQPDSKGTVGFNISSPNASVDNELHVVRYEVVNPNGDITRLIWMCTGIGVFIFWLSRFVMYIMGYDAPLRNIPMTGSRNYILVDLPGQVGIAVLIAMLAVALFCHHSARTRVETISLNMEPISEDETGSQAVLGYIGVGFYTIACGSLITYGLDYLTGSRLTPHHPEFMWAVWGGIFGAIAGFWLVSPLQGRMHLRRWVTMGTLLVMVLLAIVVASLFRDTV